MIARPEEPEPFGPLIFSYSRADALRDGVLVDVSELAREAGIKYPLAVTAGVLHVLAPWAGNPAGDVSKPEPGQPLYGTGQSFTGRAWDLLMILRLEMRRAPAGADRVDFAPLFLRDDGVTAPQAMYAVVGPGGDAEPVADSRGE